MWKFKYLSTLFGNKTHKSERDSWRNKQTNIPWKTASQNDEDKDTWVIGMCIYEVEQEIKLQVFEDKVSSH
jgi:hypothetical protein